MYAVGFIIWKAKDSSTKDGRYGLVDVGVVVGEEGDQDIDLGTGICSSFPQTGAG